MATEESTIPPASPAKLCQQCGEHPAIPGRSLCWKCRYAQYVEHGAQHPEKIPARKARKHANYLLHRDEQLAKLNAEYAADPESILARNHERYHRDVEASRAQARAAAWKNRIRRRALAKIAEGKRRQADPARAQALRQARTLRDRARQAHLPVLWNARYAEYALAWWEGGCAYCGASLSDGLWHRLHWDHFIAGTDPACPGTVPWNLLPTCGSNGGNGTGRDVPLCNPSKGNRKPEQWLLHIMLQRRAYVVGRALTAGERRACKGLVTRKLKKIAVFFEEVAAFAQERGGTPKVRCDTIMTILTV